MRVRSDYWELITHIGDYWESRNEVFHVEEPLREVLNGDSRLLPQMYDPKFFLQPAINAKFKILIYEHFDAVIKKYPIGYDESRIYETEQDVKQFWLDRLNYFKHISEDLHESTMYKHKRKASPVLDNNFYGRLMLGALLGHKGESEITIKINDGLPPGRYECDLYVRSFAIQAFSTLWDPEVEKLLKKSGFIEHGQPFIHPYPEGHCWFIPEGTDEKSEFVDTITINVEKSNKSRKDKKSCSNNKPDVSQKDDNSLDLE